MPAEDTQLADAVPTALNHVHLIALDPAAEIRFLTEALGFKRDPSHRGFVWLGNLQLAVSKGEPIRHQRFHLGFRMDSQAHVDAFRRRLLRFGVETTEPSQDGSFYTCYFTDPAGYRFEVFAEGGISALGTLPE
jgi:catechol 2,3-dioxygenase-like lactoylglutathione lyase family enzyme